MPFPPGQYWLNAPDVVNTYQTQEDAPLCLKNNIANSALAISKDLKSFKKLGRITKTVLDDRDVILFPEKIGGKYAMLHRPKEWIGEKYGCNHPSMWISFSNDLMEWETSTLLAKENFGWEEKIGGSTPPIKTKMGWLVLYHGVDNKGIYRVGAMLLDLEDPTKIIARAKDFIMEPEYDYENIGFYNGCVFPTGNVVVDDTLYDACILDCNTLEAKDFIWMRMKQTFCFKLSNDEGIYGACNINNGYNRPYGLPNAWISDKDSAEYINISFSDVQKVSEIVLTFDSDLDYYLCNTFVYEDNVFSEVVKDYTVYYKEQNEFVKLTEVKGNYQRVNRLKFDAITTNEIKIVFEATNGCKNVRVFAVNIY